jgi:hypothetical protein
VVAVARGTNYVVELGWWLGFGFEAKLAWRGVGGAPNLYRGVGGIPKD